MSIECIGELVCEQLTLGIKIDKGNVGLAAQAITRRFRRYRPDETVMVWRVPKSILPKDHLAFFVIELVNKRLDLLKILSDYNRRERRGRPPYDPIMMLTLLVYSYLSQCESSRKIEEATYDVIPCRMITGDEHPDHDTINDFRNRHLPELGRLFEQSVKLTQEAGLISLEHVAADGSKFKANASRHKAMTYDRMVQTIEKYEKEIPEILAQIELVSAGDSPFRARQLAELQKDLTIREQRLPVIKASKAALAKEMRKKAAKEKKKAKKGNKRVTKEKKQSAKVRQGKKTKKAKTPEEKAQRNFTDPDSKIMPWKKTFEQCYNAQIAVDSRAQIIVGNYVTQATNDKQQLLPMVSQIARRFGRLPDNMSADTGYFSVANVTSPLWNKLGITSLHIPPAKEEKGKKPPAPVGRIPKDISEADKMVRKLRTKAGSAIYRARKSIVEPVFGQIKRALDFDEFRLRGLKRVNQEFSFVCAIHNFKKLYTYSDQFATSTG